MIEFTVIHSAHSVREVYTRLWKKRYGLLYRATMFGCVLIATLLLVQLLAHWAWYIVLGALGMFAALLLTTRDSAIRMALQQFDLLGGDGLQYRLTETGLREKSTIARAELDWPAFEHWSEVDGYFLLMRKPADAGQFVSFPVEQLPAAAREFMLGRLPGGQQKANS